MTCKILKNLYVGDDSDAARFEFPMEPIHVIIDLRGWNVDEDAPHEDFSTVVKSLDLIKQCLENEIPVLVHCHGGIDRSPFVVACYLYKYGYFDEYSAYNLVKVKHPQTIIHDDWMDKFVVLHRTVKVRK